MSTRTLQRPKNSTRSDNYFDQIVALKDHFLHLIPDDFINYQLTVIFTGKNATSYSVDRVKKVIDDLYKRLNEIYVHPRRYASLPHRSKMPLMLTIIEFDDQVMFHTHALLAVHPDTAPQFDELCVKDSFTRFDESISASHFQRTKADDPVEIRNYEEQTNVERWINYQLKRTSTIKKPDHLMIHAPKQ
jgi:hypothetical protein